MESALGHLLGHVLFEKIYEQLHKRAQKNINILLDGEQVLYQNEAYWQSHLDRYFLQTTPRGILQLTNLRLRFMSIMPIGNGYLSYLLKDVTTVNLQNYIGFVPTGVLTEFSDGQKAIFGVAGREKWLELILAAKANAGSISEPEKTFNGTILDLDSVAIRQRLSRHFTQDELKTFCFDLGVDYDNLAGATKDEKAREIVVRLDRDGKLPQLLKRGKELRPDVVWY